MDGFLGEIRMFAGNYAPSNWALCDGQLLPINQYQALFSILGPTYGGDGRTTFALPDLRGRVGMHPGQGSGLPARRLGEMGGGDNADAARKEAVQTTPYSCVNHIICINGMFPSRD